MKYINNEVIKGYEWNWEKYYKEARKLVKEVMGDSFETIYFPEWDDCMWDMFLSERASGKTTNLLIIHLFAWKDGRMKCEYIRRKKSEVAPSNAEELYSTIKEFHYIEKIFKGEYNDIIYRREKKGWYLVHRDEDGNIDKECSDEVCHMHSLDVSPESTKSTYNSPKGDFILFDEAIPINGITTEDEWIALCQLLSTITRLRVSCKYYILANTISTYSHIFHELEIYDVVNEMEIGESRIVTSSRGTRVSVTFIALNMEATKQKRDINLLKFGFRNPRLSSIIGGEKLETRNYPHLPRKEENEERTQEPIHIYLAMYGKRYRLELWDSDVIGEYIYVRETHTKPREDAIIYTIDTPKSKQERYGMGIGDNLDKYIWNMYEWNRFYYTYNDIGTALEHYVEECA